MVCLNMVSGGQRTWSDGPTWQGDSLEHVGQEGGDEGGVHLGLVHVQQEHHCTPPRQASERVRNSLASGLDVAKVWVGVVLMPMAMQYGHAA